MKKTLYLITLFSILSILSYGQSQRLVLLEHFTQASCGPCATYNPSITAMLNANPDLFTAIMYHTSWPGYDPMYNHNTSENAARTTYYGVNSVPNSVLDGNLYNGHPNGWSLTTIENRYAVPSPFDVFVYHELSSDENIFHVKVMISASEAVAAGMKAQIAVIEKHISFSNPPGSNGESEFDNVMKKMLPNQSGTTLPAFEAGDYVIYEYEWEHQNVYDIDELSAIAFIQNNSSKEVLQAANGSDEMFTPLFANDAEVTEVRNLSLFNCDGKVQPEIDIRNNGTSELTSLDIVYSVNGGAQESYQWTGNLGFLESETVMLAESAFAVELENVLTVTIENPNGNADEYDLNNSQEVIIEKAPLGESTMILYMILDANPEETTWEVKNYEGDVIHEGGPYAVAGQTVLEQLAFVSTNCYTFTLYDEGGDGLSQGGSAAFGYGTTYLINEVDFGSKAQAQFKIEFTGINESKSFTELELFPNPTREEAIVSFMLLENEHFEYSIVNTLGKEVRSQNLGEISSGKKNFTLDLRGLEAGVYFVKIKAGDTIRSKKLIINN